MLHTKFRSSDFYFLVTESFHQIFISMFSESFHTKFGSDWHNSFCLNFCMYTTLDRGQEMTLTFNSHISSYIQLDVCSYYLSDQWLQ